MGGEGRGGEGRGGEGRGGEGRGGEGRGGEGRGGEGRGGEGGEGKGMEGCNLGHIDTHTTSLMYRSYPRVTQLPTINGRSYTYTAITLHIHLFTIIMAEGLHGRY